MDGWKKDGETWDAEWQPEFSHRLILTSLSLPSISSLMEGGKQGNLIGGKLPRSLWPEAGWGLQCVWVCVSRGGQGRRQHPGRTLGTRFPAALVTLLLRLHKSLPAGSMLPSSGGFPLFPRLCPASSDSLSLPNDPKFGHLLPLSVLSQGCGTLSMSPVSVCHPLCRLMYSSHCI